MTVYHVWLTGQAEPKQIEADEVSEYAGVLRFWDDGVAQSTQKFEPPEWQRWAVIEGKS